MGYRIHYAFAGCMMRARVSGRSTLRHADWMAREIREEAGRSAAKHLLIDVRGLYDRLGTLGALALGACPSWSGGRTAVVDTSENDRYHALSEGAARWRGQALRYFGDPASAMRWLEEECRGCTRIAACRPTSTTRATPAKSS